MLQDISHIDTDKKTKIRYNDGLVDFEDATFHAMTHALNYGTCVFEGVRVYETSEGVSIFHLDEHIDRLVESMKKIGMGTPYTKEQLMHACRETVKASGFSAGYIRPQVQFGFDRPGIGNIGKIDFFVFFWPLGKYRQGESLKIGPSKYQRLSPLAGDIEAKVGGYYVNSHFNHMYAHEKGWDDAIMLDYQGNVAEAASANIFLVKNGTLITPQTGHILKGITRKSVLMIARDELGIPVEERIVSPDEFASADECFMTGTAAEIEPVGHYDDTPIGDGGIGPITKKIKNFYNTITQGEVQKYHNWHTFL